MTQIHDTAVVSSKATLGDNIIVSPYAIIEDDVVIGNDCTIGPHAVIYNGARLGNRVKIGQGASVSNLPQDFSYKGEETFFLIDDDTVVREFVTLHKGTTTGFSKVGKNCFLMAYSHVGHDAKIGDRCILANSVQLGGHVQFEDFVIIGGGTVIHQFCRIGQHSMTGGGYRVVQDIPPYILAAHDPIRYTGLNVIGLRRRGFSNEEIMTLKNAYSVIYSNAYNLSQAKTKVEEEMGDHPLVKNILEFLTKSKRGLSGK
jgi:UDP-N-acetylglucosamine acyltransferase